MCAGGSRTSGERPSGRRTIPRTTFISDEERSTGQVRPDVLAAIEHLKRGKKYAETLQHQKSDLAAGHARSGRRGTRHAGRENPHLRQLRQTFGCIFAARSTMSFPLPIWRTGKCTGQRWKDLVQQSRCAQVPRMNGVIPLHSSGRCSIALTT